MNTVLAQALLAADTLTDQWRGPVFAGVFAVLTALIAYRQATKAAAETSRNEARRIDGEAYDRAKKWYDAEQAQQSSQITQLRTELSAERGESTRLRARVVELEDQVARMRRQLIVAGIDEGPAGHTPIVG